MDPLDLDDLKRFLAAWKYGAEEPQTAWTAGFDWLRLSVSVIEALREGLQWVKAVNVSSPMTQKVCDEALARVRGGT